MVGHFLSGMISTSMQPIFAYLVDIRHSDVYGNVYAISDMSVCLAMFLGKFSAISKQKNDNMGKRKRHVQL